MWIQLQQSKVVCCWTFSSSSPNPKAAFGFKAVNGFHKLYIAVEAEDCFYGTTNSFSNTKIQNWIPFCCSTCRQKTDSSIFYIFIKGSQKFCGLEPTKNELLILHSLWSIKKVRQCISIHFLPIHNTFQYIFCPFITFQYNLIHLKTSK